MARASSRRTRRRRGASLVVVSAMMPVVLGGLALSVDMAVLGTARAQLSTVADAAALAGARKLASAQRLGGGVLGGADVSEAQAAALAAASRNRVLNAQAVLLPNPNNANDPSKDVVVGFLGKPSNQGEALSTSTASMPYANTVQVTARRDADHSGFVPRFFGMFVRKSDYELKVTSAATVKAMVGFRKIDQTTGLNLLPIVLDIATYKAMVAGKTTDQYTYNPASNTVTKGPDGVMESMLYPVSAGLPGNWGTIKVGVNNNSTATLGAQIRSGITPAQLATFPGGRIALDQGLSPPSITFEGNPGISAGIKDDLASILGKPVYVPIYDQSGGKGNNATYRVTSFAPVRIVSVNFQGNPKYVIVQPAKMAFHPMEVWEGVTTWPADQRFRLALTR